MSESRLHGQKIIAPYSVPLAELLRPYRSLIPGLHLASPSVLEIQISHYEILCLFTFNHMRGNL
ncbi:hypothetical protein RhiirA5_363093, partial [Rhizophagus irregularis]